MVFLLRLKPDEENSRKVWARVIWQGFRHADMTSRVLGQESPMLSRLGRNLVLFIPTKARWRLFGADVKSAFLQADEVTEVTTTSRSPMRHMRLKCVIREDQHLRWTKPMFGDCRAPRFCRIIWRRRSAPSWTSRWRMPDLSAIVVETRPGPSGVRQLSAAVPVVTARVV